MTEIRTYSLWLEGEFDCIVNESPGVSPHQKYVDAYEAASARGCACTISDDTGLGDDDVGGPVVAVVHPDGEVTDHTGVHQFYVTEGSAEVHTPGLSPTRIKDGDQHELTRANAEQNGSP